MLFLQKLLAKYKDRKTNAISPQSRNNYNSVNLHAIKEFWLAHPQTYTGFPISDATPNEYLLYGKTLMLYAMGDGAPLRKPDKYPWYFANECHITNPFQLHLTLIQENYLGVPTTEQLLMQCKVSELKTIAESIGCMKSGKKNELIQRIIQTTDYETIKVHFDNCNVYFLTDKGRYFLDNNYDLVEYHQHQKYNIPLSIFLKNRFLGNTKRSFYDNAFSILSNRIYNNCVSANYATMSCDQWSLYDIAKSEGRYNDAIEEYLRLLYLNTCCIRVANYSSFDEYSYENVIVFDYRTATEILGMSEYFHPRLVENIYNDFSLPPSFLSQLEFIEAISEMLTEISFDYEKYNNIIRKRLRSYSYIH